MRIGTCLHLREVFVSVDDAGLRVGGGLSCVAGVNGSPVYNGHSAIQSSSEKKGRTALSALDGGHAVNGRVKTSSGWAR